MKILLPLAADLSYNPAYYLASAFRQLGHEAEVIDQGQLYNTHPEDADLFCAVDSGGPLNIPDSHLHKSCMWYIDSRRNSKPEIRTPDDDTTALHLLWGGGMVFQAQRQDLYRLQSKTVDHRRYIHYLPLAADPTVWSDEPVIEQPQHAAAFVGNCYDLERLSTLNKLQDQGLLHWPGIEQAVMEAGAAVYRNAKIGLNIPSFYGTPECYDVNMRVFEVLSCGRVLITNHLDELSMLGIKHGVHCMTYRDLSEIPDLIETLGQHNRWSIMGRMARDLIVKNHTYMHRAIRILEVMKEHVKQV